MQPGCRLGPYEIVAAIGAGGMGEVYRARDTRLGREVAIKVLPPELVTDPERLRRFEQEARAVAALDHPNILALHDVGSNEGGPYLVTELLEGESLRERLAGGALPMRKAVDVAAQIAQGLAAAHEKGIVHRDLKPANVFVTRDGRVKILDFGIAKLVPPRSAKELAQATTVVEATEAGAMLGTLGYMSPEQVRAGGVDHRSDIFSLGCVLHEMLSGRRAFMRDTGPDTISAILHEEPETLPASVPDPLRKIVARCLEKQPEDRFTSAHDLAFALHAFEGGVSRDLPRRREPRSGVPPRWAVAALGVVVVAAAGWWLATRGRASALPEFHPRRVAGQLGSVAEAALSPDGSEVAYSLEENGSSDIWVMDIRGGKPIRLTDGAPSFGPAWFPDGGAIAFAAIEGTGTSVRKVPRFGGTPMLLVPNAQDAAISPDGRQIAFARPDEDANLRIWTAPIGAVDKARKLTTERLGLWSHRHPAWSPDGQAICFQDKRNLWLVPARGGTARALTAGDAENSRPAWSSDARFIYFASLRDGIQSLWRIPIGGGGQVRVTQGAGEEESPTISRDGRRLAFVSGAATTAIALVDMRTAKVSRIQLGRTTKFPTIAPDRSAVVFESDLGGVSDLWSQPLGENAPSGDPARLTEHPGTSAVPAFSPDGRWIAYFRVIEGERDLWVIPAHGGAPVSLTGRGGVNIEPAWSPDGRQIAFVSDRSGREQVWIAPFVEGQGAGEPRRITDEHGTASFPCWSPSAKEIAYVLYTTGAGSEVRVADTDASRPPRTPTSGAQALIVRWWWARNVLVVSGYWGERLPKLRLVSPDGRGSTTLPLPAAVMLDPSYPDFDLSRDGTLLALYQSNKQAELWVLEAEEGLF